MLNLDSRLVVVKIRYYVKTREKPGTLLPGVIRVLELGGKRVSVALERHLVNSVILVNL